MGINKRIEKVPRMIRGSVVLHRRKCGKPNCRCAAGVERHESTVLSYSEGGRTRFVMLAAEDVDAVRAATVRYQQAKARVEEEANVGLHGLIARVAATRAARAR